MAQSECMTSKLSALHSSFTNNYLLKHGNIFMKPDTNPGVYPYPFFPGDIRFNPYSMIKDVARMTPDPAPLNFVIKEEKPPTPPASTSPVDDIKESPPDEENVCTSLTNDQSKSATWILGKQKLSWDNSTVASYNPETKMFRCVVCNAVGFLSRIAEHYLGTHTSAKVFQCLHCPYSSTWSRCVRMHMAKHHGVPNAPPSLWKGQPLLEEIFQLLTNLKTAVDSQGRDRVDPEHSDKKFVCPKCPYTTDRRDLYMRHENIHKEDKPYHCYICFKLFNRADHVKKHFLRIHRGHPYDISLVRRRPPRTSSSHVSNTSLTNGDLASSKSTVDSTSDSASPTITTLNEHKNGLRNKTVPLTGVQPIGFQCPFCAWEGADAWCLRRHMNVHLKYFECPICQFKAGKAERLFTHVYKSHRKLVCTKCRFVTDQAHIFENHIKDCCVEMIFNGQCQKDQVAEDSPNDSDTSSSSGMRKVSPTSFFQEATALKTSFMNDTTLLDKYQYSAIPSTTMTLKGSMKVYPLHHSLSYVYPTQPSIEIPQISSSYKVNGLPDSTSDSYMENKLQDSEAEIDVKKELASPVQSSSDSGVADVTSDPNDQDDLICWHCGCEFANQSSLNTHIELYHRNRDKDADKQQTSAENKKKFSCALCNFSSDKQIIILDHMRYHTGEVLSCRAGYPCAFTTIFDSTLSEHVTKEHNDGKCRCPHCGFHCSDKISFIRHYRKFHHSSSCNRCRMLKRTFSCAKATDTTDALIRPYLHHNPYSKSRNSIMPYTHCNAAMSKVAVAIPSSLQATAVNDLQISYSSMNLQKEKQSRKQSAPRKLVHKLSSNDSTKLKNQNRQICDINLLNTRKCAKKTLKNRKKKFKKQNNFRHFCCKICFANPVFYKKHSTFLLHFMWFHFKEKFHCQTCDSCFKYKYQILLHKKKLHGKK